jgi:hypothetical protein
VDELGVCLTRFRGLGVDLSFVLGNDWVGACVFPGSDSSATELYYDSKW